MTLAFHPNIRNLYLGRGIAAAFSNPFSISVYSGIQPAAEFITSNWDLHNAGTSNFLVHYTDASWSQPSSGLLLQLNLPAAQVVLNDGTAAWAILWVSAVTLSAAQGTTLPQASFLVVPCSDGVGQGVIRFADPELISGAPTAILDGSIGAYTV